MFYIRDWANVENKFNKEFKTWDQADSYLTAYIEKTYPEAVECEDTFYEEIQEYIIEEVGE